MKKFWKEYIQNQNKINAIQNTTDHRSFKTSQNKLLLDPVLIHDLYPNKSLDEEFLLVTTKDEKSANYSINDLKIDPATEEWDTVKIVINNKEYILYSNFHLEDDGIKCKLHVNLYTWMLVNQEPEYFKTQLLLQGNSLEEVEEAIEKFKDLSSYAPHKLDEED